uniref:snRNA-activating protein complex subunit 1 n=1 Tax=Graphocephala atropunctata TaxID=36148 RepID=A0A1B6MP04_9HEMI
MVVPLNQAYIKMVNDFRTECKNLTDKFKEKYSEDFKDFVPLWKSFKFNLIYEKYSRYGLNCDFKEDSLQIGKDIMLNDYFVGGIFLLYGLYFVQEDPKASIRIELYEFERLLKLLRDERKTLIETCQPGYLFAKLLKNDAFAFVRFSREFSMEGQNRSRMVFSGKLMLMEETRPFNEKKWVQGFLNKINFIDTLKKIDEDYYQSKKKLQDDHPELNLALATVPDDFISGMMKNLVRPVNQEKRNEEPKSIGAIRKGLKRRKMRIRRRHAGHLLETQASTSTARPVKKKRGGKVKHYFNSMVNNPETQSENSSASELDDTSLSVPYI